MHEFKETVLQTLEHSYDPRTAQSRPKKPYEFPTGFNTSFGKLRFQIPELIFDPKYILGQTSTFPGLGQLTHGVVASIDPDIRALMLQNVVLTGAASLLSGVAERLNYELGVLAPGVKVRVHAAGNSVERKYGAWIGGSILASLGTFHQLWISKAEYDEFGVNILDRR